MTAIRETDRETEKLIKNNMLQSKKATIARPFQERRAIARTRAHTRAKAFRGVINCMRKSNF